MSRDATGVDGAGDRRDAVDPHTGRLVRDPAATGFGGGLRRPVRVDVHLRAHVRVVDAVAGARAGARITGRGRGGRRRWLLAGADRAVQGERRRVGVGGTGVAAVEADLGRGV